MALYLGSNKYAGAANIDTKLMNTTAVAGQWVAATSSTTPNDSICAAYQVIAVSGINSNCKIVAGLSDSCTLAQRKAGANAELFVSAIGTNTITLCCSEASYIPTVDIPISLWVMSMGVN